MIVTTLYCIAYIVVGIIIAYAITIGSTTPGIFKTWLLILFWPLLVLFILITLIVCGPSELIRKLRKE